jgi:hypothetical protein
MFRLYAELTPAKFDVSLTVRLSKTLASDQLDAQI